MYVDGFLLPVPKANLDAYRTMAQKAGEVWIEYGALGFKECLADDLKAEFSQNPFTKAAAAKEDEVVIFSFILFPSKEKRDEINAKVMQDPRLAEHCGGDGMPFDMTRMSYGGFTTLVDL